MPAILAGVHYTAKAGFLYTFEPGYLACRQQQVAETWHMRRFSFLSPFEPLPWNDKDVNRRLWFDVPKSDAVLIFVDHVGGDLAAQDSVENCVYHHFFRITEWSVVVYSGFSFNLSWA